MTASFSKDSIFHGVNVSKWRIMWWTSERHKCIRKLYVYRRNLMEGSSWETENNIQTRECSWRFGVRVEKICLTHFLILIVWNRKKKSSPFLCHFGDTAQCCLRNLSPLPPLLLPYRWCFPRLFITESITFWPLVNDLNDGFPNLVAEDLQTSFSAEAARSVLKDSIGTLR